MTNQMSVTKYLQSGKTFEDLNREFGINVRVSDDGKRSILNYDHIESRQKYHPIVRECRALTINTETFEPVARSFPKMTKTSSGLFLDIKSRDRSENLVA